MREPGRIADPHVWTTRSLEARPFLFCIHPGQKPAEKLWKPTASELCSIPPSVFQMENRLVPIGVLLKRRHRSGRRSFAKSGPRHRFRRCCSLSLVSLWTPDIDCLNGPEIRSDSFCWCAGQQPDGPVDRASNAVVCSRCVEAPARARIMHSGTHGCHNSLLNPEDQTHALQTEVSEST